MKLNLLFLSLLSAVVSSVSADELQRNTIYVNSDVTTHIMMPENLKMVDISTENIVGNQCADNMIRIKPVVQDSVSNNNLYSDDDFLGTLTMIGERHVVQYDIRYITNPMSANAMYRVNYDDSFNYTNPEVSMPESEMARLAWTAYGSKRKFHNIRNSQYGIKAEVFNIYSVGNYFFIDFVLKNQTKLPYDIAEMRVSLSDKKQTKATNFQTVELTPLYVLNDAKKFNKGFRQVIVLDKLTFPDEKILNIEISENQISGRVITIPIQYQDILNADCFDMDKIDGELVELKNSRDRIKKLTDNESEFEKTLKKKDAELEKALKKKEAELENKYKELIKNNASMKSELEKTKSELYLIKRRLNTFRKSVEDTLEAMNLEGSEILPDDFQMAMIDSK